MEINRIVKATLKEIKEHFQFDEVVSIRYYNQLEENKFEIIARIPECNLKDSKRVENYETFRNKVIDKCTETFKFVTPVKFTDGSAKSFYSSTLYWCEEYPKLYSETFGKEIELIEPTTVYKPKNKSEENVFSCKKY